MSLNDYLKDTQLLLNDPKEERFNLFDLRTYVNMARGQAAGEGECVRVYATLAVNEVTNVYPFSNIALPSFAVGVGGFTNIRMVTYNVGTGATRVTAREWEWFNNFVLSSARPSISPPTHWAQYGQGTLGSLFLNYLDGPYTLNLDTVCFPSPLIVDTDADVIPYYWTDSVPYYAAYLALLPREGMEQKADHMLQLYKASVQRARQFATPSVLPGQYSQATDPTLIAKLGLRQSASKTADESR